MNTNTSFVEKLRWRVKTIENKFRQYNLTTHETTVADTEYGKVMGVKRMTVYDQPYFSFEGIPYAQPPVGALRFKAPQRPTPWEGVKDCTGPKEKATQVSIIFNKVEGSEDCLYLNVYTNNLSPEKARPVLVWIHGGGFIIGEANRDWYGPEYFMRKDVVVVTIQYRLGVLGFLSLKTPSLNIPGNAGLKDQVMALKWIKNNCASFGGDPDCITVFGESAGAASTHYMTITDQTQGLFHRAILMSGNATAGWAFNDDGSKFAPKIAKLAGYKGEEDEKEILQFLLNAKAKDLIRVEEKVLTDEDRGRHVMFPFAPTLEPYVTPDCVLPKPPKEMMKTAWGNSIPIMVGNTSNEGLIFNAFLKQKPEMLLTLETCVPFVPPELCPDNEGAANEIVELGQKIKNLHVGDAEAVTENHFFEVANYLHFWFPMHRMIQARFKHGGNTAPVFIYRFDFDSEVIINPYRIMRWGRGVKGVSHADELTYLFWNILAYRLPKDSREYRTLERCIDIWTQFATTGNPFNENINGMADQHWEALKKSDEVYKCMNISDELKFIDVPEMAKIKSWEALFDKHPEYFLGC